MTNERDPDEYVMGKAQERRSPVHDDKVPDESLESAKIRLDALRLRDHELDHKLKKYLGSITLFILVLQFAATNVGCVFYAVIVMRRGLELPTEAIIGWMSATIVEIVALALVVAKYLFPGEGGDWNKEHH